MPSNWSATEGENEIQSQGQASERASTPANESVTEREDEVQSQEPSSQKTCLLANLSVTGGKNEMQLQEPTSEQDSMPADQSVTGGGTEIHTQESSNHKINTPVNESEDLVMTDRAPTEEQIQEQPSHDTSDPQIVVKVVIPRNRRPKINDHEANAGSAEESKSEGFKNKLATSKRDLKIVKGQLQKKRKDLIARNKQLKESKAMVSGLKANNRKLQDSLSIFKRDKYKCVDELYSLHKKAQTPDSTISAQFESLSQQIVHWIEAEVAAFEKAHPEAKPDHVFSVGEDKDAVTFLELHPGAGEHLARYLIHHFLQDNVFGDKVYFFGLPEEIAQLLERAELDLAGLDPPRDSVAIASWRSETLTALAKNTEFAANVDSHSQTFTKRLFRDLSNALPSIFSSRGVRAFHAQILLPAIKLANIIRMSTSDYVFSLPERAVKEFKPVTVEKLKKHTMIDFKTGRTLKPDSAVVADKDGNIGNIVISLEPGLYRLMKPNKSVLRQEVFLVELHHPLGKRSKATT